MSRLATSVSELRARLAALDLSDPAAVADVLAATWARRTLDLSDLSPTEQAALIAARASHVLPTVAGLAARIGEHRAADRPAIIKLGIDPTGKDVHLGHAVPMILLSRFERMGHQVVLIIGDFTAKIGDPSGRSAERPALTDADIAENLATYRDQVAPFFDFDRAQLRRNGDWLGQVRLPELIGVLSHIPVSQALQRDDFRKRLDAGTGLAMSEFLYGVVMALDSVEIDATVELGGVDQLLNLQMGRTVMDIHGQTPQLVVTVPLIEGLDGSGAKMSKSADNYIALSDPPGEIFGKIMSVPDRLMVPYLRAWTEWDDTEIAVLEARTVAHTVHPMDVKRLLAGEMVAVLHGLDAAATARADWNAQFSQRSFGDVGSLPEVSIAAHGSRTVAEVLTDVLGFTKGTSAARRLAEQGGLKLLFGEQAVPLAATDVYAALLDAVETRRPAGDAPAFLRAGRKVARLT